MHGLAVVIPALEEEESLRRHLPAVMSVADEVVVSDGGSTDATAEVARTLGAVVVTGEAGRGPQLNRGAAATTSPALLFLHADTTLPDGARVAIETALEAGFEGGGFLLRFDRRTLSLRLAETLINLRTRLTEAPLGDQAHFVLRSRFEDLGGYRPWPILEDLDFALRLGRSAPIAILRHRVTTSARRYAKGGVLRTAFLNWWIWLLFAAGVSPHRLARLYHDVR